MAENRTPVRRKGAQRYLLMSLVSFALTVIGTRVFLQLTGFPQLGGGGLHIAHVLWGGLLLFVAALLPLLFSNRWVYSWVAILGGAGVGLFIDEVGKFITQTNDYFYPPAAPIIYAFFLLTVMLYTRVRNPPPRTPRDELYRLFEDLTEVLDCDLDSREREDMERRLLHVAEATDDPNLRRLIPALVQFLQEEELAMVEPRETRTQAAARRAREWADRIATRRRLRFGLAVGLGSMGVIAGIELVGLLLAIIGPGSALETFLLPMVTRGALHSAAEATWFVVLVLLQGAAGFALVASGALLAMGRERPGLRAATLALIVWLTGINLLVFYYDQFGAITFTLIQFILLLGLQYYRSRYMK